MSTSAMKALLQSLELPCDSVLYLHVRLKGIADIAEYQGYSEASVALIEILQHLYKPKAIFIPTFTYSFTKSGIYNRVTTPCEVGRFGEESRKFYSFSKRTIDPIFSGVDVTGFTTSMGISYDTAFGEGSLLSKLHEMGHIVININTPKLISTYFHYLEFKYNVDYRFSKCFSGQVSGDGVTYKTVNYDYYVRNLELDTTWRRDKIEDFLFKKRALRKHNHEGIKLSWFYSGEVDKHLGHKLKIEPRFMITDK